MADRERYLRLALELAEQSVAEGGGPFGAVIVKDGEVVGQGSNRVTLHHDPTAHAEVQAIRDACRRVGDFQLHGCELYVSCAPCPMCLSAAYWARLERVWFAASREAAAEAGFDDQYVAEQLALVPERRDLPAQQLPVEGADQPFLAWRSKPDRVDY